MKINFDKCLNKGSRNGKLITLLFNLLLLKIDDGDPILYAHQYLLNEYDFIFHMSVNF